MIRLGYHGMSVVVQSKLSLRSEGAGRSAQSVALSAAQQSLRVSIALALALPDHHFLAP